MIGSHILIVEGIVPVDWHYTLRAAGDPMCTDSDNDATEGDLDMQQRSLTSTIYLFILLERRKQADDDRIFHHLRK